MRQYVQPLLFSGDRSLDKVKLISRVSVPQANLPLVTINYNYPTCNYKLDDILKFV